MTSPVVSDCVPGGRSDLVGILGRDASASRCPCSCTPGDTWLGVTWPEDKRGCTEQVAPGCEGRGVEGSSLAGFLVEMRCYDLRSTGSAGR